MRFTASTDAATLPGKVFHAGTTLEDGKVVTNGGRVLCAVGLGTTVSEAQRAAYALCDKIQLGWCAVSPRYRLSRRAERASEEVALGALPGRSKFYWPAAGAEFRFGASASHSNFFVACGRLRIRNSMPKQSQ